MLLNKICVLGTINDEEKVREATNYNKARIFLLEAFWDFCIAADMTALALTGM